MIKGLDNTVNVYGMEPVKGKGAILFDKSGKKYIDMLAGVAVNVLGYNDPDINRAVKKQVDRYIHISRLFANEHQNELTKLIIKNTFGKQVYFVNSGAEANEVAIKLARKWGLLNKKGAYKIITFYNSFHGRTIATLTATAQEKFHKYLKPLSPGFVYAKFNDINDVKKKIDPKTAAILIEPIQAEGGVYAADAGFLKQLRLLCDRKKIMLIFDEVQTGMGRTGSLYAYQGYKVTPDVMTIGKGLGGGFPLAGAVVSKKFAGVFSLGDHGTTMGGNPVACVAGNIAVKKVANPAFLKKVTEKGKFLMDELKKIKTDKIKDVRGRGLLIGLELTVPADGVVKEAMKKGLLLNSPKPNLIRIVPPLVISKEEIKRAVNIIAGILR